ncbi:hypothetical protein SEUCBS139899_007629 [Sporothrix eucalyptigena]|uniref:Uncharacterized protein n=1 Tax=Sporothrix eucalyptigena TaxID=1812306 RepID=A0ABP0AT34_9PEZI
MRNTINLDINDVDQVRAVKLQCLRWDLDNTMKMQADPSNTLEVAYHIDNVKFLIKFYEDGGIPPAPGTTRWVRDGQFVETAGRFPEPFLPNTYTADPGIIYQ